MLRFGHLPAKAVTDPDLLKALADQLPAPMRSLCVSLDYSQPDGSLRYMASLDASLPDELRRRFRFSDLRRLGASHRQIRNHILPDGRDACGNWWYFATVADYLEEQKRKSRK